MFHLFFLIIFKNILKSEKIQTHRKFLSFDKNVVKVQDLFIDISKKMINLIFCNESYLRKLK